MTMVEATITPIPEGNSHTMISGADDDDKMVEVDGELGRGEEVGVWESVSVVECLGASKSDDEGEREHVDESEGGGGEEDGGEDVGEDDDEEEREVVEVDGDDGGDEVVGEAVGESDDEEER